MPHRAEDCSRPGPREAYAQWTDMCGNAGWHGSPAAERVPVAGALGRVTAAGVSARWASPAVACAAMDGIALRAAGSGPRDGTWVLAARAFTRVDTGDPMPPGTDTVVQRERVSIRADGSAVVSGAAPRGLNVRPAGEDFQAGQVLIPAGRRIRPGDLGAAAAAGHATLAVARRPAVAIIPTGDEIRPVGTVPRHGEITDSNSVMLAARAEQAGAVPAVTAIQPDDPDVLAAELRRAALTADLVLVIAGSSRGRDDYTAAVLAQVGGVAVHGVAVRPGHPVLLGHVKPGNPAHAGPGGAGADNAGEGTGIVPVIGVPGYPLAAAVIFELFALPLLAALQGSGAPARPAVPARLARDWESSPDVEDWVPVSLALATSATPGISATSGAPGAVVSPASALRIPWHPETAGLREATPVRRGSGSTSQLARADAWWTIPRGRGTYAKGDVIGVFPFPGAPW